MLSVLTYHSSTFNDVTGKKLIVITVKDLGTCTTFFTEITTKWKRTLAEEASFCVTASCVVGTGHIDTC